MAVIDQINVAVVSSVSNNPDATRNVIAGQFWIWFDRHQEDRVTTVKIWLFHKTLYVRDLRPIFVMLFGDPQ